MSAILTVNSVTKLYATHRALNSVSLEVPEKSIFGLLGPNGAGKTSLIRIINQITAPDSGDILFKNEKLSPGHVERIGYLPEERGLYRKMKVGDQAVYLARLKGMSKKEALTKLKYWFEKFEMGSWWNKKIEELSKGMQQKVQFIVTILHEPELLILDEPFSGFDPINANLIKNEILELKKKGTTIIFSTHNMGSVEELCDNIALLNRSEKVLDGPVKQIRQKYKANMFEITYRGTPMAFAHALWTGAQLISERSEDGDITALIKLNGQVKSNELLGALLPAVEIRGFREILPTMNDIFIKVVGEENAAGTKSNYTE
jgi:ABC-2 type transport system ATP-binding protein